MATGDLTVLEDVKAWLAISDIDTAADDILSRLISSASLFLTNWLNRQVLSANYTERYNGNGKQFLRLPAWPITAIASLSSNRNAIPASPDGIKDGYVFDDATVYLLGMYYFDKGIRNIFITYTAGYVSVPLDIAQATIELVSLKFKERQRIGKNSETLAGQQTFAYSAVELSKGTKSMLQNYRNVIPS